MKIAIDRIPFIRNRLDHHMQEVVSGAFVAFVLKLISAGLSFGFNVLLARMLGAEGAGVFFLALTVVTVTSVLSRMGLDNTLLRFVASNAAVGDWVAVKGIYRKGISLAFVTSGTATLFLFVLSPWLANAVFSKPELAWPLRWMSLAIAPLSLLNLHAEVLKGLKRIRDSILIQGVCMWGLPLIGISLLAGEWRVQGAVTAYILGSMITVYVGYRLWQNATPYLNDIAGHFKTSLLLKSCMPLYVVAAMNMVLNWATNLMLGLWATEADVGIFSVAMRTAMLISFVYVAVNSISAPKFAALYTRGEMDALGNTARNSAMLLTFFALPLLLLFLVFPEFVMGIFGEEFERGAIALSILAIGQFVNTATGAVGYLLIMTGNELLMRNNFIIAASVNILLNVILIPAFGLLGAAIAVAVSVSLQNLVASYMVYRALNLKVLPWPVFKLKK